MGTSRSASSITRCDGAREQPGSVALASPVSRRAWQRQPPKSSVRRSQLRQGSGIHDSPRNFWNTPDSCQIHSRECSRTLSKVSSGITPAAWQGSALPVGSEGGAVFERPSVILSVGDLDAIRPQLFQERNHFFQVIEVLPVDHQVCSEGDAMPLDPASQLNLVRV